MAMPLSFPELELGLYRPDHHRFIWPLKKIIHMYQYFKFNFKVIQESNTHIQVSK